MTFEPSETRLFLDPDERAFGSSSAGSEAFGESSSRGEGGLLEGSMGNARTPLNEAWLGQVLADFDCQTGSLHRASDEFLELVVAIGIPAKLMPMIGRIPFGKGIAGAAAATKEPVELCNLQQDLGGVARERARSTQVAGSVAIPVLAADGATVLGTLGIGKHEPHAFTEEEKRRLAGIAREVAGVWEPG